jgi:hypothetical protein
MVFFLGVRRGWTRSQRGGLHTEVVRQDEAEQSDQDEKPRQIEKPIMTERLSPGAGGIARAMAFVRMMMVFTHGGTYTKKSANISRSSHFGNLVADFLDGMCGAGFCTSSFGRRRPLRER